MRTRNFLPAPLGHKRVGPGQRPTWVPGLGLGRRECTSSGLHRGLGTLPTQPLLEAGPWPGLQSHRLSLLPRQFQLP